MSDDELIAKQQREIEALKEENKRFVEAFDKIEMVLICVGGPLNDNKLGYTEKQLNPFFKILDLIPFYEDRSW